MGFRLIALIVTIILGRNVSGCIVILIIETLLETVLWMIVSGDHRSDY